MAEISPNAALPVPAAQWRLIDDWQWVVNHAWSMRLLILAAVLSGAEAILPLFMENPPVPRQLFALISFVIVVGAFAARLVAQREQS